MKSLVESEKNRQKLLSEIIHWWVGNGWNPLTLNNKTEQQLIAIRGRMRFSRNKT